MVTRAPSRPRGRPRRHSVDEVRRRCLDAAAAVTAERGIAAVTISEVAGRAGVDRSTIYAEFTSLDGLLVAAVDRALDRFRSRLLDIVEATADDPPRELVGRRLDAMIGFLDDHADDAGLIDAAERDGDPTLRDRTATAKHAVLEEFIAIRKAARNLPDDTRGDALEILTAAHWGMYQSVAQQWRSHPHWQRDHLVELLGEFITAGYGWLTLERPDLFADPAAPIGGGPDDDTPTR